MSKQSGYDGREPDSQVRSIIKQLNEERPSKEKSREVVVRPDGTKVIRVVKKRKVMISGEEKVKKAKRRFLILLLTFFVFCGLVAGFFGMRMSMMSGDSYIQDRQEALREAWGAKSVRCVGARVDGFTFAAESLVVEFPESAILERVELRNISAQLSSASFFSGVLQGDELVIDSANICMREGVEKLDLPRPSGKELWKFRRIICPKFSFTIGDEYTSPLSISQSSAYVYSPSGGNSSLVLTLEGGQLKLKGWDDATIASGKMLISPAAVEDFKITCSMNGSASESTENTPSFFISGKLENGGKLVGPYGFASCNVPFRLLDSGCFARFFSAVTNDKLNGEAAAGNYVCLPFHGEPMSFHGKFAVKDISFFSLPALDVLNSHIHISRSQSYTPTTIKLGAVELQDNDGATSLVISELTEPDKIRIRGKLTRDAQKTLSGTLEYGIPVLLARTEYTDEFADQVFSNDDGSYAWLVTTVSGTADAPVDNARELDAAAAPSREGRKRSVDLDSMVDRMSKNSSRREHAQTDTTTEPAKTVTGQPATTPATDVPAEPAKTEPSTPEPATSAVETPAGTPATEPSQEQDGLESDPQGQGDQPISLPGLQLPTDDVFNTGKDGNFSLPSDDLFSTDKK